MNPSAEKSNRPVLVHGTALAISGIAILLRGKPGAGKSDFALRLMDQPGRGIGQASLTADLIADDQVYLTDSGNHLIVSCPPVISGKLEVRGLGLMRVFPHPPAPLGLVVDLLTPSTIDRLPTPEDLQISLMGHMLPCVQLDPASPSACSRLRAALQHLVNIN